MIRIVELLITNLCMSVGNFHRNRIYFQTY